MTPVTDEQLSVLRGSEASVAVGKSRALLVEQARRAATLGHTLSIEQRDRSEEFPEEGAAAIKFWGVCSCGYRSRARSTHSVALWAAFAHVGDVLGEADAARAAAKNGVSVPGSVRPAL